MSQGSSSVGQYALNVGIVILTAAVLFLGYSLFQRSAAPRPDPTRVFNPNGLLGDIIQVDVRNGCGVSGLASRLTTFLRSYDFDVVEYGNHSDQNVPETLVIDRIGNLDAARQVAMALDIPQSRIIQDIRPDYYLDVSVVIGLDYRTLPPFRDEE
jgi:LytR cell envelope-related transcriptional attenuator